MIFKVLAGLVAVALMLLYMAPVVLRLQDVALWIIVLLGLGMMIVDLWQSLQSKDD